MLGKVIVLSAVGSVTAKVVSKLSFVEPSKTRGLAPERTSPVKSAVPVNAPLNVPALIVGLVKVLLANVCVASNKAILDVFDKSVEAIVMFPVPSND